MKHIKKLELKEQYSPEYEDEYTGYVCIINGKRFVNQVDDAIEMTIWALKQYGGATRFNIHELEIFTRKE